MMLIMSTGRSSTIRSTRCAGERWTAKLLGITWQPFSGCGIMTIHHWAFGIWTNDRAVLSHFKPFHASSHVCYQRQVNFMIILLRILLCLPYGNAFLLGQELAVEWRALSTTECIAFQERFFQRCRMHRTLQALYRSWKHVQVHIVEHPYLALSAFCGVHWQDLFQHQLPLEVELLSDSKPCRCHV